MKKWKKLQAVFLSSLCAAGLFGSEAGSFFAAEQNGESFIRGITEFSVNMLVQTMEEADETEESDNILISPISAAVVLATAEIGASGETLSEMKQVLCRKLSEEEFQTELSIFLRNCSKAEETSVLSAQAVVLKDDGSTELQTSFEDMSSQLFDAEIMEMQFDDDALNTINQWVNEKSEGLIPELIEKIDPAAQLYLLNTLAFKGNWEEPYSSHQVMENQTFYSANGSSSTVNMLSGTQEHYFRLKDGDGFTKPYQGGQYDFFALLPPVGMELKDYAASVSAEAFLEAYRLRTDEKIVYTCIPEYTVNRELSLNETMQALGMNRAFSEQAEFDRITVGESSLCISLLLQKAVFDLNRKGTYASAASVAELGDIAAEGMKKEVVEIILNRPFLFGIVESSSGIPLFLGVVNSL